MLTDDEGHIIQIGENTKTNNRGNNIYLKLLNPYVIYILTNGFGTPESGYATLSKFWEKV